MVEATLEDFRIEKQLHAQITSAMRIQDDRVPDGINERVYSNFRHRVLTLYHLSAHFLPEVRVQYWVVTPSELLISHHDNERFLEKIKQCIARRVLKHRSPPDGCMKDVVARLRKKFPSSWVVCRSFGQKVSN